MVSRIHGHIESIIKAIINEIASATQIDISNVYNQSKEINPSFQKIIRSQLEKIVCHFIINSILLSLLFCTKKISGKYLLLHQKLNN